MSGFGYYGYDSWGFLLNTYNPLRRTNFEESYLSFQDTTLTTKTATSEDEDVYSYSATFENSDLGSSIYVTDLSWSFLYNDWVAEVCDQPLSSTLSGKHYELNYPNAQELELIFDDLIDTQYDRRQSSWFRTCFPIVSVLVPSSAYDNFSIVSIDAADRATIKVEQLANADIYAARTTIFGGTSVKYYEKVRYQLQLADHLASKY